jgi:uncharacterized protein
MKNPIKVFKNIFSIEDEPKVIAKGFAMGSFIGKKILGVNLSFHIRESINFKFISIILKAGSDVFLSLLVGGAIVGLITSSLAYYLVHRLLIKRNG